MKLLEGTVSDESKTSEISIIMTKWLTVCNVIYYTLQVISIAYIIHSFVPYITFTDILSLQFSHWGIISKLDNYR